jgi:rfaE bifunctional protein kinase chain/domain
MKAEKLRKELQLDALLVTRSEDGMSLYQANQVQHEPTQTREVFDVSGAGDTVIATLAVMLASGAALPDAMSIANRAAGIVVGKLGTAVVSREEIIQDMGN